jgi:hypothetical protein
MSASQSLTTATTASGRLSALIIILHPRGLDWELARQTASTLNRQPQTIMNHIEDGSQLKVLGLDAFL